MMTRIMSAQEVERGFALLEKDPEREKKLGRDAAALQIPDSIFSWPLSSNERRQLQMETPLVRTVRRDSTQIARGLPLYVAITYNVFPPFVGQGMSKKEADDNALNAAQEAIALSNEQG